MLETMKTTVNERVKSLREYLGLSQDDFAHGIETTITSISRMENGFTVPRASTLQKMVNVYGADKDWLINGKGDLTVKNAVKETPIAWKDEAFNALKEEVSYLREMLKIAIGSKGNPNFRKATELLRVA